MSINMTEIANFSPSEVVSFCNNELTIPSLIILFMLTHITFLIIGSLLTDKKAKLFKISAFSFLISLVFLLTLIFLPHTVKSVVDLFIN